MENSFIEWPGGRRPVPGDVRVEVRLRNGGGVDQIGPARDWRWSRLSASYDYDVVGYRIALGERTATGLSRVIRQWLERVESRKALQKCGGDQRCPWCAQWMNQFYATRVRELEADPMLDEITCGSCGGASAWKWEIGFLFICSTKAPPSASRQSDFGDGPFIRDVIARVRAHGPSA